MGSAAFVLQQHHEAREGQHGDEEEEIVADDGADEAHLCSAGGEDTVFGELVEAAEQELEGDEVEDDGGNAEEALEVDFDAAADEEHAKDDGDGDAEDGSGEAEDLGGVERDGGEDEDGFDAFAEDEEEDEEEEAEFGGVFDELGDLAFDVTFEGSGGLVHEPDHADDECGCGEHDPALKDVGVDVGAGDDDGGGDAGSDGGAESPEDGFLEFGTADFGEVGKDDADDE